MTKQEKFLEKGEYSPHEVKCSKCGQVVFVQKMGMPAFAEYACTKCKTPLDIFKDCLTCANTKP